MLNETDVGRSYALFQVLDGLVAWAREHNKQMYDTLMDDIHKVEVDFSVIGINRGFPMGRDYLTPHYADLLAATLKQRENK